jgi:LysR family nitrogen assimilation transcriptional regulator
MELRQLRYFVQVVEAGSVRAASSRVHVAQSALSRHIAALEDELGVALLERHARGVATTRAGARLVERARAILRQVDETRAEIMAEGGVPAGAAAIGASAGTSRLIYGRLAERFAADYPSIDLGLVEGAPYLLLEGLDTGRLDLAVMVDPEPRASLAFDVLAVEQVYLIGAKGERRMPGAKARVSDLAGLPLVLFPRPSGSRMSYERAAAAAGLALTMAYEVDGQEVIKDLIARGLGFGLLPFSSIDRDVRQSRFAAVPVEELTLTRTLVGHADRPETPAVATLAEIVRDEFRALEAAGAFAARQG